MPKATDHTPAAVSIKSSHFRPGKNLFQSPLLCFVGHRYVKDADKAILARLKAEGRVVHLGSIRHSYPFCWRSDTPLIYKARALAEPLTLRV